MRLKVLFLLVIYCFTACLAFSRFRGAERQKYASFSSKLTEVPRQETPRVSVILTNIQSGNNIGRICRNCLAFNISEVIVVGKKGYNGKMRGADQGARVHLNFKHFVTLEEVQAYLRAINTEIIGVEIDNRSVSLSQKPFRGHTAFIFGNEGSGLSEKQRSICDSFVYIPQFAEGMASINVACASAVILYTFADWAKYPETSRNENKFTVQATPNYSKYKPSHVDTESHGG